MNLPTEISPSTQLLLDEINKLFDKYEAKWDQRFAEMNAARDRRLGSWGGSVSVLNPAAAMEANVVADNWGSLFDGSDAADGAEAVAIEAIIAADNWGSLFDGGDAADGVDLAPSAATHAADFVAHSEQEWRAAITHSAHLFADTPTLLSARPPTTERIHPDLNVATIELLPTKCSTFRLDNITYSAANGSVAPTVLPQPSDATRLFKAVPDVRLRLGLIDDLGQMPDPSWLDPPEPPDPAPPTLALPSSQPQPGEANCPFVLNTDSSGLLQLSMTRVAPLIHVNDDSRCFVFDGAMGSVLCFRSAASTQQPGLLCCIRSRADNVGFSPSSLFAVPAGTVCSTLCIVGCGRVGGPLSILLVNLHSISFDASKVLNKMCSHHLHTRIAMLEPTLCLSDTLFATLNASAAARPASGSPCSAFMDGKEVLTVPHLRPIVEWGVIDVPSNIIVAAFTTYLFKCPNHISGVSRAIYMPGMTKYDSAPGNTDSRRPWPPPLHDHISLLTDIPMLRLRLFRDLVLRQTWSTPMALEVWIEKVTALVKASAVHVRDVPELSVAFQNMAKQIPEIVWPPPMHISNMLGIGSKWYDQSKLLVLTVRQLSSSSTLCLAYCWCFAHSVYAESFLVKWPAQLLCSVSSTQMLVSRMVMLNYDQIKVCVSTIIPALGNVSESATVGVHWVFKEMSSSPAAHVHFKSSVAIVPPRVYIGCIQIADGSLVRSFLTESITCGASASSTAPFLVMVGSSRYYSCASLRLLDSAQAQRNLQMTGLLCLNREQFILVTWKFWTWFNNYTSDMFMLLKVSWSPCVWARCESVMWGSTGNIILIFAIDQSTIRWDPGAKLMAFLHSNSFDPFKICSSCNIWCTGWSPLMQQNHGIGLSACTVQVFQLQSLLAKTCINTSSICQDFNLIYATCVLRAIGCWIATTLMSFERRNFEGTHSSMAFKLALWLSLATIRQLLHYSGTVQAWQYNISIQLFF